MKRREAIKGPSSTDLLVCFPTRSHLTLMPKTICSPSRTSSNPQNHRHPHYHRGKSAGGGLWSKRNQMGSELSEPTSPKVTCAGQIKVRPKSGPCKNWQSVMEEIEMRLHNNKKHRKKPNWVEAIGLKKESMQFLTCLRSFKFDLGCFGAFPSAGVTSDDEVDDDDDDEIHHLDQDDHEDGSSRSAFSKWFMVLENLEETEKPKDDGGDDDDEAPCVPPSNALLLMRCHSAPAKSWLEEKEEEEDEDEDDDNGEEHDDDDDDDDGEEHDDDDGKKRENLMELMKYEGDFYKLSCDIAKETWVVGGMKEDPFSRTQRCSTKCLEEVKAYLQ
ncbi:hypothetical protein Ccrd_022229 [Cynara cardunculus var. scolymus]|uniref:Uncharacterized protein n=1 Tax=Cynara cardunculus var. scolymus TaxID=59895 RepID=A0A118JZH8_CYNCS|nr:hypothetical protein Ccrd_022229 [Cynara cardunculus var. scolymus]